MGARQPIQGWKAPTPPIGTKSDIEPINILSSTDTSRANFWDTLGTGHRGYTDATNCLSPVGAFAASAGPYDMGGNVFQWNEAVFPICTACIVAGRVLVFQLRLMASSWQYDFAPSYMDERFRFRVARRPPSRVVCHHVAHRPACWPTLGGGKLSPWGSGQRYPPTFGTTLAAPAASGGMPLPANPSRLPQPTI